MGIIYRWAAKILAGLVAVLLVWLNATQRQRDKAEEKAQNQERRADTAEARIDQRHKADEVSQTAKETGDARVEESRDKARTGSRDHFSSGMRDD